ncbi:G2/mitotic-specific cyclin-B-like isoform X2 [Drosophila elegans]|uniref:G2/mitotic-specific cyclin-B-like isoform X2 n=1 Tax=Drosophila elegans TaxID=30023 RepID=UPI001BC854A1|nr:G2/mitotic-specific cyclin-B-like isoform X2 [Drosophila elegans]
MVGTTLKMRDDENAWKNFKQVQLKKLTKPSQEATTKCAALGDLLQLTDARRNATARVDIYWKKAQENISNGNTAASPKEEGGSALLRANSMRNRIPTKPTTRREPETKTEVVENKKAVSEAKKEVTRMPLIAATTSTMPSTMSLSSKRLAGIEDIDANDKENLVLVSEYVNDIYDYLYQTEQQQPIHKDHLAGQKEFHLTPETFQLTVTIIDRYLQVVKDTKRNYFQLVGVAALFIAAKYEERCRPTIVDLVFITDDTYTARQIRQMELQILKAIDYNLSRPLPIHFLRRYSKAAGADDKHHAMSKYFIELASVDYDMATYRPSEIAAASLFLSLHLLNGNYRAGTGFNDRHWTPTLTYYSRYSAAHLRPITRLIAKLARDAPQAKLKAIYNKYQGSKFQKIALRMELSGALMDSIVGQSQWK